MPGHPGPRGQRALPVQAVRVSHTPPHFSTRKAQGVGRAWTPWTDRASGVHRVRPRPDHQPLNRPPPSGRPSSPERARYLRATGPGRGHVATSPCRNLPRGSEQRRLGPVASAVAGATVRTDPSATGPDGSLALLRGWFVSLGRSGFLSLTRPVLLRLNGFIPRKEILRRAYADSPGPHAATHPPLPSRYPNTRLQTR